jgi:ferrous iron transport protein B
VAVVIIWALGYFPRHSANTQTYQTQIEAITVNLEQNSTDSLSIAQWQMQTDSLTQLMQSEQLEQSYLGRLGHFIEPVMRPLGFNWQMSIALLAGTAAKEVVVGTIGVLVQNSADDDAGFIQKLQNLTHTSGKKVGQNVITPVVALSFLIFVLIYAPCIGVVSAIARESGRWKYALFMVGYTTTLAWVLSFIVYQIGNILWAYML